MIGEITTAAFAPMPFSTGTEARIIEALRSSGALTISLVAEHDGEIIGHIAFSPILIDGEDRGWFGLGPVSVKRGMQGQGIGKALILTGLEQLNAGGAAGCVLLGDPGYYGRFGFSCDPELTYTGGPPEAFQFLVLNGPHATGAVSYHPAFDVS